VISFLLVLGMLAFGYIIGFIAGRASRLCDAVIDKLAARIAAFGDGHEDVS
jgi:ABC-type dipeptide/oligopeptide/nickel transport system permease subunit